MTETTATPAASNSTQPTNATNGTTASTNTTIVAPTNLKYPVVQADGKEYSSIETLLDDLANETEGAYLLGTNFCWHGGIHISSKNEKFVHHKDQKMVRCMMDGTVVAYRLNKEYCTESWKPTDTSEEKALQYSTGFCLVKHDYVSPANNEEGENKGKTNSLTFYSLYIHLADFSAYHLNEDETTTAGTQYILEKNRNVRSTDDIQTVLGVLGKDSVVEVAVGDSVERHLINQYHREYDFYKAKIISISAHGSDSTLSVGSTIYITTEKLKSKSEAPKTLLFPAYWKGTVTAQTDRSNMWIYASEDECKTHHAATSILKKGTQEVTFTLDKIKQASNNIMAECTLPNSPEYTPGSTVWSSNKAWMYVTQGTQLTWTKFTPDESNYDKVILCNIPIKAGDPIGFMGAWDNPILDSPTGAIETSHMMHIELFSEADKATLETLLNNEAKLKSGRQYLKIPQGLKPLIEDGGRLVSCDVHNSDFSFGITKECCIELDGSVNKKETKEDKEYYCLTGLEVGNETLQKNTPLNVKCYIDAATTNVKSLSQYDLKEIGYQILDEANQSTNGYVSPENITSQLYKGIFEQVDVDHSNGLSASEIHDAFRNKSLRRQINQIIAGHPSEWHQETQVQIKSLYDDKISKTTNEINKKLMTLEKKRIESCEFLSQVPLGKKVWHFQPLEFLNYFIKIADFIDRNPVVKCTRRKVGTSIHYGPRVTGNIRIEGDESLVYWEELLTENVVTDREKNIIIKMSKNEGNIDAVQSYDSEVVTAGAMQKTVPSESKGELNSQMQEFKDSHPNEYSSFFSSKGWDLDDGNVFYQNESFNEGNRLTGLQLKSALRSMCNADNYGSVVDCEPIRVLSNAISQPLFIKKQLIDFVLRLRTVCALNVNGYRLDEIFKSDFGLAIALDHHVNRQSHVVPHVKSAIKNLNEEYQSISDNISLWGVNHERNEMLLIDIYGRGRTDMTDGLKRYLNIKEAFGL